jgi:hypothetical protein
MIWVRRLIAIGLGILMIPLLIVTLLSLRVNDTFLEEQFYKDQLVEADIYNFLYTDALTVAIDQEIEKAGGMPLNINLTTEEIVEAIQATLPPDWIQHEVELAIDDAVPYLTGETDELSLTIGLSERADGALIVIQRLLNSMDIHATLFDEAIPDGIANSYGPEIDIALGITLTAEEVASSIEVVITPEVLEDLQTQVAEDIGPYLTGKSETFTFNIPLAEQVDVIRREFRRILQGVDLKPFILDEVLDPALDEFLNEGVELPLGVVITRAEIRQATEAALTPEWVDAQADTLVNGILPYLTGESDRFTVSVPVRDRIDVAVVTLTATVDQKYTALLNSLPACTPSQVIQIALGAADPTSLLCTIPGLTVELLKSGLGIDPLDFLAQSITDQLPTTITFTEQDLLAGIGSGEESDTLDDVRTAIRDGWTLDETDLRKLLTALDPASLDNLDYVRETIRDGWNWTEDDLLELVYEIDDPSYGEDIEDFNDTRGYIDRARSWSFGLPLLSLLLLLMTGFIGGRKWITKLGWAAGALFISALVVSVFSGPLYDTLAKDELEKERSERIATADDQLEVLLIEKIADTGLQIGDVFFDGVESRAMILLLVGGVVMGGSVVFSIIGGGSSHVRKPGKESMLSPEPQSVADMPREAEENLGEPTGSSSPEQPTDEGEDESSADSSEGNATPDDAEASEDEDEDKEKN